MERSLPSSITTIVRLIERGERARPGEIGARRPNRWMFVVIIAGELWQRDALCDVLSHVPSANELIQNFTDQPHMWRAVSLLPEPGAKTL